MGRRSALHVALVEGVHELMDRRLDLHIGRQGSGRHRRHGESGRAEKQVFHECFSRAGFRRRGTHITIRQTPYLSSTIWVWVTNAISLPSSLVTPVCQTLD